MSLKLISLTNFSLIYRLNKNDEVFEKYFGGDFWIYLEIDLVWVLSLMAYQH